MADILLRDARNEIIQELRDTNQTKFKDPELIVYFNDAVDFVKKHVFNINKFATIPEEFPRIYIDKDEFSSDYKHDLPTNYDRYLFIRRDGYEDPIRIVTLRDLYKTTTQNRGFIYGTRVGAPVPNSNNSGTDDLETQEASGGYTDSNDDTVTVTIASGTTFNWTSTNNGSGSGVTITGAWQALANGIQIKFGSTSGYTAGDIWTFDVYATQQINVLELNYAPSEDIELWYMKRHTKWTTVSDLLPANTYLPMFRYYLAIKQYIILRCRNRNEENALQDMKVFQPIFDTITMIAQTIASDDDTYYNPEFDSEDYI
jgi:hypothetical protein